MSPLCHLSLSFVGVFLGLSASLVFYLYGNYWAVFWAYLSASIAALNLHLHILKVRAQLAKWHSDSTMSAIKTLAMVFFVPIFALFLWFVFEVYYQHLPVYPIKDSLVIISVWNFMAAKWTLMLYFTSSKYERFLREENTPLLTP